MTQIKGIAKTLGIGLLPSLDVSKPAYLMAESDMCDSIIFGEEHIDRWYTSTKAPNELFFTSGDESNIQIIEREGFNNIHVWYPKGIHPRQFVGYSPCQTIVPITLRHGE